jgi:hypothetical protein
MNWTKILSIVGGVSAAAALVATIIAGYNVLTTDEELVAVKHEIISEMRREVVKNRGVMISSMQREADDILWQMSLEDENSDKYRYLSEKHRTITREIEELKNGQTP